MQTVSDKITYLTKDDISFCVNESGLITAKYKNEDVGRVAVLRMFPFEFEEEYLCVRCETYSRADKEEEIGIIRSLSEFGPCEQEIVRNELKKRYFVPEIVKVEEVKDEFGHTMWKTETTAGKREFTVTDMSTNVYNLGNNKIMLTDVYGNRYCIPDITKTDDKTLKVLEIWI